MSVPVYTEITLNDWDEYGNGIILLEKEYPSEIASDEEDLRGKIGRSGSLSVAILRKGKIAGFAFGFPLSDEEIKEYHLSDFWKSNSIYLESITIAPEYQGKGYGRALIIEFMRRAKIRGLSRMIGHFRPNASAAIMRKLGATELALEKNWFNTGQDYICYEIRLG